MAQLKDLSKRERQVMTALYQGTPASVGDLLDRMTDPTTYSAVRATLRVLEEKGWIAHQIDGRRYLYKPKIDTEKARKAALKDLVSTFFDGSAETAAAALLGMSEAGVTDDTIARLKIQVEQARNEGR